MKSRLIHAAARCARSDLAAATGAGPLLALLATIDSPHFSPPAPEPARETAWALGGLGWAMASDLAAAFGRAGREVVGVIATLHQALYQTAQPAAGFAGETPSAGLNHTTPYLPFLGALGGASPEARAIGVRWIDAFSERLTMHRYSDPAHRRRQARDLLAAPLAFLACGEYQKNNKPPGDVAQPPPAVNSAMDNANVEMHSRGGLCHKHEGLIGRGTGFNALDCFTERLLMFWDLMHAERDAARGWNRIAPVAADRLGGFYGLSDTARPVEEKMVRQAVADLLEQVTREPLKLDKTGAPEWLITWLQWTEAGLALRLEVFLQTGQWPGWHTSPPPKRRWWRIG